MTESAPADDSATFLVQLQEQYYAAVGGTPRVFTQEGMQYASEALARGLYPSNESDHNERAAEMYKSMKQAIADTPSPYEDPINYSIMKGLSFEIQSAIDLLGLKLTSRPVIGTLPLHDINARTVLIPGSTEHLVLFDHGLFVFALLLAKAIAQAFPIRDGQNGQGDQIILDLSREAIVGNITENPAVSRRFIQALSGYIMGRPSNAPQYFTTPFYTHISQFMINSLELFILGHEYGHVIAGHLSAETPTAALLPDAANSAEAVEYSWKQEYEADFYGEVLSIVAMNEKFKDAGDAMKFKYAGSELFFGAVDAVDRAISTIAYGHDRSRRASFTHPPSSQRRLNIRQSLPGIMQSEHAASAVQMGEIIEDAMEVLWQAAMPTFLNLYEEINAGRSPNA
jgi:hypothetical protein